jgi:iron-sulfur cluster repair protein YtfE (RIC family)
MISTTALTPSITVNEAVHLFPATLPVFQRQGIDSCCGGAHSLQEVARKHGMEVEALLKELRSAVEHQHQAPDR